MTMRRLPWTIINGFFAVCLLSAAILLMTPTEFSRENNQAVGVRIDWSNLLCTTPKPNVAVTDGEVHEFWQLPKTVRLSPQLNESGRCSVAVAKYNAVRSNKIDASICYCANIWWLPVVTLISLGLSLVSLILCIGGIVARKSKMLTAREVNAQRRLELVRNILFFIGSLAFVFNCGSVFTYTDYGDVFPTNYLDTLPTSWIVALWLFVGGNMIQTVCFLFFKACAQPCQPCSCKRASKAKPMETMKSFPSPPKISTPSPDLPKLFDGADVQTLDRVSERDSSSEESMAIRFKSTHSSPPALFTVCECVSVAEKSDTASSLSSIMLTAVDEADQSSVLPGEKNPKPKVDIVVEDTVLKLDKDDVKEKVAGKSEVKDKIDGEGEDKSMVIVPIIHGSNGSEDEKAKEKAKSEVEESKEKKKEAVEVKEEKEGKKE